MAYRVFTLPVHDPGAAETELNGFLASHRVLSVDPPGQRPDDPAQLRKLCVLKPEAMSILKAAMEELGLSARAHDKVLRVFPHYR